MLQAILEPCVQAIRIANRVVGLSDQATMSRLAPWGAPETYDGTRQMSTRDLWDARPPPSR